MIEDSLNTLFLATCIILVFLMQAGFLCLEAGAVRHKNSINVAAKNLMDLILVASVYVLIGFRIQYGSFDTFFSSEPIIDESLVHQGFTELFIIFQALFAATAATIVAGAVAERCGLAAYLIISLLIGTLIFPIVGGWVWGGVLGTPVGWLAEFGFVDFAGSSVVHGLGGAVSLAAIMIIGPRKGVFSGALTGTGQNLVLSLLGVLLLWLGWYGFNVGSLLTMGPLLSKVFTNTSIAGCVGGVAASIWSYCYYKHANLKVIANGVLAGLVGITAGAHAVNLWAAAVIGGVAGMVCCLATIVLIRLKLDDVIGAIPVHLAAGAWGSLAVGLFGNLDVLGTGHDRVTQVSVQFLGVISIFIWSFGISYCLLSLVNRFIPLRVSEEEEERGLNVSEHGAVTELSELVFELHQQAESGQLSPLGIDPFSELSAITEQYNRVLTRFARSQSSLQQNMRVLEDVRDELQIQKERAEQASQHKSQFLAKMSDELRTPLNGIVTLSDSLVSEQLSDDQRKSVDVILQSSRALLAMIDDILDFPKGEKDQLSGQKPVSHKSGFNLKSLLEQSVALFSTETLNRPITLNLEFGADIPLVIEGDSMHLRQILINLLGNAFKFTQQGVITLSAEYDYMTGLLTVAVSDTGQGIELSRINEIFEADKPEECAFASQSGGKGLAICRQLAELLDGRLEVSSVVGQGSTFTLLIPMRQ
ncbi:ammonium transporter [Endozoicomonas atrinae]|uniref:ammonium transporter n=1 Tax=Endozoicomonas atrinae TaxID=1333660 RepID=UPI000825A996|nr:ammonium transporter [Endozoicomonas atrinae]